MDITINFEAQAYDDKSKTFDMQKMVRQYFSDIELKGDNSYFCNYCGQHKDAIKTVQPIKLPPYLILTINRFAYASLEKGSEKIIDPVDILFDFRVGDIIPNCPQEHASERY